MNRNEMEFLLDANNYIKGGSKESALFVLEFLNESENALKKLNVESCISNEEFIQAIKTLVGFAHEHEDTKVKTWFCDCRCYLSDYNLCPGKFNIDDNAKGLCPHFIDKF